MRNDRKRTRDSPEILTVEQIGPQRSITPEGFLLCKDVPIARIGTMMYGPGELPLEAGSDGVVYVTRTAEELFKPETLASFSGKPVTDEHPDDDVTPANWRQLARGHALNVRQGEGENADVILADLLITDAKMIRDIDAMKREVSAGYDADYEQTGDGQGIQTNIIANHIALVERGRCGPRCAIGDQAHTERKSMATTFRKAATPPRKRISKATLDALMEQLGEEDASTMDDGELTGKADGGTHIHIHGVGGTAPATQGAGPADATKDEGEPPAAGGAEGNGSTLDPKTEARFASLENGHKEIIAQIAALTKAISGDGGSGGEDPSGTKDADPEDKKDDEEDKEKTKTKTKDSAALETSYKEVLAGCEVLVPGFRMPTFDASIKRAATIDRMCAARRKALDAFGASVTGARVVSEVAGTKDVDTTGMTCVEVAALFKSTVGAQRLLNNSKATRDANTMAVQPGQQAGFTKPASMAELNEIYRKHYAGTR